MLDDFLSPTILSLLAVFLGVCLVFYRYLTSDFGKFESLGVPRVVKEEPKLFFGNAKDVIKGRKHNIDHHLELYREFKGNKIGVLYEGNEACLYVRDLDLIKDIMVRSFDHFTDFGFQADKVAKMSKNYLGLASMTGHKWREARAVLSHAFAPNNIKNITEDIDRLAARVAKTVEEDARKGKPINVEGMTGIFTMECIARLAYSMDINAASDPDNNEFIKQGASLVYDWRFYMSSFFPEIMYRLNISMFNPESIAYFTNVAAQIMRERRNNPDQDIAKDLLGCMMQEVKKADADVSDLDIQRTLMELFLDGYDTLATPICWAMHYLALNPHIQERAYAEVKEVLSTCQGEHLTTDDASRLKYLDQIFTESMRLSAIPFLARTCTEEWTLPEGNVKIPRGTRVIIPLLGIHMDPEFFQDPESFDPDRFDPGNRYNLVSGTFLSFGQGPRQCPGVRIARLESRMLLFNVLRRCRLEPCEKTNRKRKWAMESMNRIEGGFWLRLVPREDDAL